MAKSRDDGPGTRKRFHSRLVIELNYETPVFRVDPDSEFGIHREREGAVVDQVLVYVDERLVLARSIDATRSVCGHGERICTHMTSLGWNQNMDPHSGRRTPPPEHESGVEIAPRLRVEDHGSEFYLVSEGDGHDLTLALEAPVAERLARFILARRGRTASGHVE